MVNATEGWAVGGAGTILHYSNGTWETYTSPTSRDLYSAYMVNSTLGWATGRGGVILKYTLGDLQSSQSSTKCGEILFEIDAANIDALKTVPEAEIPEEGRPPVDFICDLFSINITNLTPGQKVNLTLTFPEPVPTDTEFWKHGPTIADPTPHWYQIMFEDNDGDNVIKVQFQDGGTGDGDLTVNSVINDPSGIGIPIPPPVPVGGILDGVFNFSSIIIAGISTVVLSIGIAFKKEHRK